MAPKWAGSAFDGEGASLHGGRWNSKGSRVVYTAGSLALACLELLVNIDYERTLLDYVAIPVEFDESLVLRVSRASLPGDWQSPTALPRTRAIGDSWLARGSSAVLEIPSRIVPEEGNYLLDPDHPGFASVRIGQPRAFRFDPDLIKIPPRDRSTKPRSSTAHRPGSCSSTSSYRSCGPPSSPFRR